MSASEEETPYALAKRLHAMGTDGAEIERALRARGLDEDEAKIAARAGRGEAGFAAGLVARELAEPVKLAPPTEPPAHPCPTHAQWPVMATCSRCGKFICMQCLSDAGLTALPESKQCPECETRSPVVQGIGGWLVLPALHVTLVGPLSIVGGIVTSVKAFGEVAPKLYPPMVVELIFHLGLLAITVTAAIHFFLKKRSAVLWMIAFYAGLLLSQLVSMVLVSWMEDLAGMKLGDTESPGRTVGAFASSLLWISYFAASQRVKATFVVP